MPPSSHAATTAPRPTIAQAAYVLSAPKASFCPEPHQPAGKELVLLGRSNVGKSSFINAMLQRKNLAKTSNTPGKTRYINVYEVLLKAQAPAETPADDDYTLQAPVPWYWMDLPGYGYAKVSKTEQQHWQKHLGEFLLERDTLSHTLVLVDGRHGLLAADEQMLHWLFAEQRWRSVPPMVVLTKADQSDQKTLQKAENGIAQFLATHRYPPLRVQRFSATKGLGVGPCWQWLLGSNASA
jgi:GTP-binding protein